MTELVVDWCAHEATRFACLNYHYARVMPVGRLSEFGVWEDGTFVGAVVFGRGTAAYAPKTYGIHQEQLAELVRVALRRHRSPVSQIVALVVKKLHDHNPGLRLLTSYADPRAGHHGGIYQAMNWVYVGETNTVESVRMPSGKLEHRRPYTGLQFGSNERKAWPKGATWQTVPAKHRYVLGLDRNMRRRLAAMALPYPAAEVSKGDARLSSREGPVRSQLAAP